MVLTAASLAPVLAGAAGPASGREPRWTGEQTRRRRWALLVCTPLLFALGFLVFGPSVRSGLFAAYSAFFLLLAVIDLEHRIVPNQLVLPAMLIAPATGWLWGHSLLSMLLGGAIHASFMLLSGLLFTWALKKDALGMGDVKLAVVLGVVTGLQGVFTSLMAGFIISGLVSGGLVVARVRGMRDYIPFAPFMLAGALIALLAAVPPP